MLKSCLLAVFWILIPFSSAAMEYLAVNAPGDLHITVFVTDSAGFLRDWVKTPPAHALNISTINEAKYDQEVQAGFAITGFTKGQDSKVNLIVGVQVTAPDGSILLHSEKWAVYTKDDTIDQGIIIVEPFLGIEAKPGDPEGNYKISATVTDKIAGQKATASTILQIK